MTDFQNVAHKSRPMSSLNETKYQNPLIILGLWKQALIDSCDLSFFVKFDLWSVGVILFELFSGLKFERAIYKFTWKEITLANLKEFKDCVQNTYL